MTTNEMLMNNTNDLQERLIISNKKILELIDKVKELDKKLVGVNYSLGGAEIYLNDIRELLND